MGMLEPKALVCPRPAAGRAKLQGCECLPCSPARTCSDASSHRPPSQPALAAESRDSQSRARRKNLAPVFSDQDTEQLFYQLFARLTQHHVSHRRFECFPAWVPAGRWGLLNHADFWVHFCEVFPRCPCTSWCTRKSDGSFVGCAPAANRCLCHGVTTGTAGEASLVNRLHTGFAFVMSI